MWLLVPSAAMFCSTLVAVLLLMLRIPSDYVVQPGSRSRFQADPVSFVGLGGSPPIRLG